MKSKTLLNKLEQKMKVNHDKTGSRLLSRLIKSTLMYVPLAAALIAAPTASAKDIPGATQTSYTVSPGGAFSFQIPIVIPQGVNGVQPSLSLSFSSSRGNGPLGVGWGISGLSSITRCGKTVATHGINGGVLHDVNDQFCLNGKPLIRISGAHGANGSEYRTEIDEFSRITAHGTAAQAINGGTTPERWVVERKSGMIYHYGKTANSRYTLAGTNSIHSWKLSEVHDRNGNYYEVSYRAGEGYPSNIKYTKNGSSNSGQEIKFDYGTSATRPDVRDRYMLGSKTTYDDRLKFIQVLNDGVETRRYDLSYEVAPVTEKSRLTGVTECGIGGACMPPIQVEWRTETPGFNSSSAAANTAPHAMYNHTLLGNNRELIYGQWADVNGDGKADQIVAVKLPNGTTKLLTYIRVSGGWSEQSQWRLKKPLRNYHTAITNSSKIFSNVINQGMLTDVNGDGLVDVVYAYTYEHLNGVYTNLKETWLNNGNGWTLSPQYAPPDYIFSYRDNSAALTNAQGNLYDSYVETMRGRFVDIDGDGLVDWVGAYHKFNNGNHRSTYLNNGSTWVPAPNYKLPDVFAEYRREHSLRHGQLIDLNGDGLLDWLQAYYVVTEGVETKGAWINTGTKFEPTTDFVLPDVIYENAGSWLYPHTRGSFVDVNGDGLRDYVQDSEGGPAGNGYPKTRKTWLNNGSDWVAAPTAYNAPFLHKDHTYMGHTGASGKQPGNNWPVNERGFYVDLNRDGLVDFVQSYISVFGNTERAAWLNTGQGWGSEITSSTDPFYPQSTFFDYSGLDNSQVHFGELMDINNDGSPDWVEGREGSRSSRIHRIGRSDRVAKITTTMDVEIKPSFAALTSSSALYTKTPIDNVTGQPLQAVPGARLFAGPMYVTDNVQTTRPDGSGFNTTYYEYAGAQVSREGRGFLGFYEFSAISSEKGITNYRQFNQAFPYTGSTAKTVAYDGDHPISITSTAYNHTATTRLEGLKTYFPHVTSTIGQQAELAANGGKTYRTSSGSFLYDAYGNVTERLVKTGVDINNYLNETHTVLGYDTNYVSSWLIGLVSLNTQTTTTTGKPAQANQTSYTYNDKGQLVTSTREPNAAETGIKLVSTYTYDALGNIKSTQTNSPTEPSLGSRINSINYDSQNRLPIQVTDAEGMVSSITYDAKCDLPEIIKDANELNTIVDHDDFCREIKTTFPDSTSTDTTYLDNPNCPTGAICQTDPKFSVVSQTTGQTAVNTYLNAFNQSIVSTTTGMLGRTIVQENRYDLHGRLAAQSQPFFANEGIYWTENYYDILDRTTRTVLPFGDNGGVQAEVNYAYQIDSQNRMVRVTTDVEGRTTRSYANVLGQIEQISDANNEMMSYFYDSRGSLEKTTDALNNSIELQYDRLGRRTVLDDPDMGVSQYSYSAWGETLTQTDAKQQTLTMQYDKLGRLTHRTVPDVPGSNSGGLSTFAYDVYNTNNRGRGSLSSVTGPNGYSKTYNYDSNGRLLSDSTTIKGQTYNQSYAYDPTTGFLASRQYPESGAGNAFGVKYGYTNGFLSQIQTDANNGYPCVELWRADDYDALGRSRLETLGQFIATQRTFKGGQGVLERIQSVLRINGGATVQNLEYSYDSLNNLSSRADLVNGTSETFEYDNLDRLTSYEKGAEVTQVQYDAIGNITYKSDVGTYEYMANKPHALKRVDLPLGASTNLDQFKVNWEWDGSVETKEMPVVQPGSSQTSIHGQDFTYDANGNVGVSGNRSIYWTAFDKPYKMLSTDSNNNQKGSVIEYGPDFERIYKQEATFNSLGHLQSVTETTSYLGKDYERITDENGNVTHRYTIVAGSNAIQIERADGSNVDSPKYLLGDNLGSTHVILDNRGQIEQTLAFDPWGMRLNVGDTSAVNSVTNRGYTGHEMDDETGLVNMNARIYDPYLGRFLSADSVLPDPGDMQAFNRYSYVLGNPLKYTDPTGHISVEINIEIGGPAFDESGGGLRITTREALEAYEAYWDERFEEDGYLVDNDPPVDPEVDRVEVNFTFGLVQESNGEKCATKLCAALAYLTNSTTFNSIYQRAISFGVVILEVPTAISEFDPEKNVIIWDPLSGTNSINGILSSAIDIAHELAHAIRYHEVGAEQFERELTAPIISSEMRSDGFVTVFGVSEEEKRATVVQNIVAAELGHPLRNGYRDDEPYAVKDPVFNCHRGTPNCL